MKRRIHTPKVSRALSRIGERIRLIRKARGLTTTDLGKRVGLSQAQISRLETGLQGVRSLVLLRLAAALRVSPLVFFIEDSMSRKLSKRLPRNIIRGLDLVARL